MKNYLKSSLMIGIPLALSVGWLVFLKYGLFFGLAAGIVAGIYSAGLAVFINFATKKQVFQIEKGIAKPRFTVAKWVLALAGLLCIATILFVYLYTPFGQGISSSDLPVVVGGLIALVLIVFVGGFVQLTKLTSAEDVIKVLRQPFLALDRLFVIMLFAFVFVFIGLSLFYGTKIGGVGIFILYIIYRLYRTFDITNRPGTKHAK